MDLHEDPGKLVEAARNAEPGAVAALCERYYPRILKFMHYRAGADQAGDLAGEVFLKLMRSIGGQTGNFEAWLYRIARNVIIDRSRYRRVRPEVELDPERDDPPDARADLDRTVSNPLDLEYALSRLNDEQREVLTLKFIQGLDAATIAEITGKTPGAIRVLQCRALKTLQEMMSKDGESHG